MNPTSYTYDSGAVETFNLTRGPQTPEGHAVATFMYSDGGVYDGYVNLEWLRNRLDVLGYGVDSTSLRAGQLTPEDISDAMVLRAMQVHYTHRNLLDNYNAGLVSAMRRTLAAALSEPEPRPENAEDIEQAMKEFDEDFEAYGFAGLADHLAEKGFQFVPDTSKHCGLGPCCLNDGHSGSCRM